MKSKPLALTGFAVSKGPTDGGIEGEVSRGAEVVGAVDESFEGFIHATFRGSGVFVMTGCAGELSTKQVFTVHQMNALARPERSFQLGVVGLPSYDLGVRATEIGVNDNFSGIRYEHLPNVRKPELVLGRQTLELGGGQLGRCDVHEPHTRFGSYR